MKQHHQSKMSKIKIKFGDIEYFELLSFRDSLKGWRLSKIGLDNLQPLKQEVDDWIKEINDEETIERNKIKDNDDKR
jgi:hypothetical protein